MKIFGLPGTSFSPSRALGVDVLKRSIAKKTGIPMTKSGLERKVGRTIIKNVKKLIYNFLFCITENRVAFNKTCPYKS